MSSEKLKKKNEAIRLRKLGNSYNEINAHLGIAKSTLSLWLKDLSLSKSIKHEKIKEAKKIWAHNIITYNKQRAQKAREAALDLQIESATEIRAISKNELKLIGIALYWAEGYKRAQWNGMFCNSDPFMVKMMMRFFRDVCEIPDDRFRPQVQIHSIAEKDSCEKFWSEIVGLNINKFRRPLVQLAKSSKRKRPFNRLPYGTFRVTIADAKFLYRMKGWLKGISQLA